MEGSIGVEVRVEGGIWEDDRGRYRVEVRVVVRGQAHILHC